MRCADDEGRAVFGWTVAGRDAPCVVSTTLSNRVINLGSRKFLFIVLTMITQRRASEAC
jgi:hypothetical protein